MFVYSIFSNVNRFGCGARTREAGSISAMKRFVFSSYRLCL